jgi:hypothetical protein
VIVAVGSDKGSPGATTLVMLLGLFWAGERVVCELDPRGADLPFRLSSPDGRPLATSPSIATFAVDARPGLAPRPVDVYAQHTSLGLPVIPGEVSSHRFSRIAPHLPSVISVAAQWQGSLIADLGCLQQWNPALLVAKAATVVVLVTRADTESLAHLRDRAVELAAEVGGSHRMQTPLGVVVRCDGREERAAVSRVEKLLASIGSPAPVIGGVADDPAGAEALWSGHISSRALRRPLFASSRIVANNLRLLWPELSEPAGWTSTRADDSVAPAGAYR